MNFDILLQAESLSPAPDRGTLVLVAALFFVSILAHRLWRGKIRAEDEREALKKDLAFSQGRYRAAFRALQSPVAFADRATGLVMEVTPGWSQAGLPEAGKPIWSQVPQLEPEWRGIPSPDADGQVAGLLTLSAGTQTLLATPLPGESLGVVLLEPR